MRETAESAKRGGSTGFCSPDLRRRRHAVHEDAMVDSEFEAVGAEVGLVAGGQSAGRRGGGHGTEEIETTGRQSAWGAFACGRGAC